MDTAELRRDVPLLSGELGPPIHYLDNMTCTLAPRFVLDAMHVYHTRVGSIPIRSGGGRAQHALSERSVEMLFEARSRVAALINAKITEIYFVESAVAAVNMLSTMLQLTAGADAVLGEVVVDEGEHYDNLLPWTARGGKPVIVKVGPDGEPDLEDYVSHFGSARLATLAHVSHVTGSVRPVRELARACREDGVLSLIDASHSIARVPIDVQELGCDFLVFSSHNLLCPPGVGVLYVREEAAKELVPFLFGGGGVNRVDGGGSFFVISDRPWRFEPGPVNLGGAVGLGVACEAMRKHGMSQVESRERELRRAIISTLEDIDGIRVLGPSAGVGIVSFATSASKAFANDHLAVVLSDRFRVVIRAGCLHAMPMLHRLSTGEAACVSVAPYNDLSDVEALGEGLRILQRALAPAPAVG